MLKQLYHLKEKKGKESYASNQSTRQAHFDAQKKQAEGMTNVAAQNLALKIAAVKEKKRKAAEAFAVKENKKKK